MKSRFVQYSNEIDVKHFQLWVNDGVNISTEYVNITIIPVPDSPPVLNPDGDLIMTENMGLISVIYNIIDEDQLPEHQLISQINISIDNPSINEVSVHYIYIYIYIYTV